MTKKLKRIKKCMGATMICLMASAPVTAFAVPTGCLAGFVIPIFGLLTFAIPDCRP